MWTFVPLNFYQLTDSKVKLKTNNFNEQVCFDAEEMHEIVFLN